ASGRPGERKSSPDGRSGGIVSVNRPGGSASMTVGRIIPRSGSVLLSGRRAALALVALAFACTAGAPLAAGPRVRHPQRGTGPTVSKARILASVGDPTSVTARVSISTSGLARLPRGGILFIAMDYSALELLDAGQVRMVLRVGDLVRGCGPV